MVTLTVDRFYRVPQIVVLVCLVAFCQSAWSAGSSVGIKVPMSNVSSHARELVAEHMKVPANGVSVQSIWLITQNQVNASIQPGAQSSSIGKKPMILAMVTSESLGNLNKSIEDPEGYRFAIGVGLSPRGPMYNTLPWLVSYNPKTSRPIALYRSDHFLFSNTEKIQEDKRILELFEEFKINLITDSGEGVQPSITFVKTLGDISGNKHILFELENVRALGKFFDLFRHFLGKDNGLRTQILPVPYDANLGSNDLQKLNSTPSLTSYNLSEARKLGAQTTTQALVLSDYFDEVRLPGGYDDWKFLSRPATSWNDKSPAASCGRVLGQK